MANRRNQFREYLARLDAGADPYAAISSNLYVERPDSTAGRILKLLEIKPKASHMLVGGIGCGKTTQLLVARDHLTKLEDTNALYIDVSQYLDLSKSTSGALFAVVGLSLIRLPILNAEIEDLEVYTKWFIEWANGFHVSDHEYDYDDTRWVPGVITPPSGFDSDFLRKIEWFTAILHSRVSRGADLVCLIDSLDRMTDLKLFADFVKNDIRALLSTGVGVVVVGPLRAVYGIERTVTDYFDQLLWLSAVDPRFDEDAKRFLHEVLERRVPRDVIRFVADDLVRWSGGVLRDLVQLAHLALQEAYISGGNVVGDSDIHRAVDAFGRTLLVGLTPRDLSTLQKLRNGGSFFETSERELALLATRRVLEYRDVGPRYVVHPTLAPLLEQLS